VDGNCPPIDVALPTAEVLERIATDHSSWAHDDKLLLAKVGFTDRQFDS